MLPDYLAHGLAVVFVGTAAGEQSAAQSVQFVRATVIECTRIVSGCQRRYRSNVSIFVRTHRKLCPFNVLGNGVG